MDIKTRYKRLVGRLKTEVVRMGKHLTSEDIAFELGYTRNFFDKLVSAAGNPTEEHIKDMLLHFPELLDLDTNITNNPSYQKLQSELELTKELLKEKDAMIRALEAELKSAKRVIELQEKLMKEKEAGASHSGH